MSGPPAELVGIWLHSHEEDSGSTMVFRPRHYAFRPARWRDAIEVQADGRCVWHGSGPDDRGQAMPGRWEDLGNGRAQITIPTAAGQPFQRQIQSCGPEKLVVEKEH
ncbi:hypothetical protein QFZ65_002433 [Arthrobacter sp. B3I9]|uniref:hypothetical protein n=1 Tax=Arthrobacter sp. B3I9 TaxID=3042270 RepID=UPI00278CCE8A|nr:hypothetical protein [Arthrobacter sp. B3I9]MDQ0850495.1 hypothetical protein [Arthrobacter sp. B3I9]